jgi:glycosyltransferase involved in cell wall biosynthesis
VKAASTHLKKVAVVIPCHNEAAGIAQVISKFPRAELLENGMQLQVYVVDNNSSDDTAAIAKAAGAKVIHESNQAKVMPCGPVSRAWGQRLTMSSCLTAMIPIALRKLCVSSSRSKAAFATW